MADKQSEAIRQRDFILAVVSRLASAAVLKDLERAGFSGAQALTGEQATLVLDPKGEHSGPAGKLLRMVQDHLSEETDYLMQYEDEAQKGQTVLAVPMANKEDVEVARDIIGRHGGRNVRLFGTVAVTDLTPLSNPSLRADETVERLEERG
jgi:hypothetical protein